MMVNLLMRRTPANRSSQKAQNKRASMLMGIKMATRKIRSTPSNQKEHLTLNILGHEQIDQEEALA